MVRFDSWSPDNETLAYWTFTEQEAADSYAHPPGTLHFLNARTGRACPYPYDAAYGYGDTALAWMPDGKVIVFGSDGARRGTPCSDDFIQATDKPSAHTNAPNPSLSPKGSRQANTTTRTEADFTLSVTTTIVRVSTGQVEDVIDWKHRGGKGGLGLGGQWLNEDQFLIHETLDRGPLLITVGKEVTEVAPELFGGPPSAPIPDEGRAATAVVEGTNTYHILLTTVGFETHYPQARLYHSETGEVEELPFRHAWWPAFSANGRWLLLNEPLYTRGYESQAIWIHPVDPVGSEVRLLVGDISFYSAWSPDWTRVAFSIPEDGIIVLSFPEGIQLGSWRMGNYEASPTAWSPNGERLAIYGYVSGVQQQALFIIRVSQKSEPPPNSNSTL